MLVSRRTVLKQVLFVSAGLALLPSCVHMKMPSTFIAPHLNLAVLDEHLLIDLADSLIPATNTPGAKDVKADHFAVTMIDDCFTKEEQQQWMNGLRAFQSTCEHMNGQNFTKCSPAERLKVIAVMEGKDANSDAASNFYHTYKHLVIQGYTNSEYFLTKVRPYELVPGRFHGSVLVKG